jgi:cytoskeleton protein RodZ
MTEEAVNEHIPVEPEPKVGPGPALREAREARNFTQEAVAKQLRIDPALVRALEDDDYSKFAAPIYVTGHLRTYARLLGLPPETFIEAYQNLGAAAPPSLERVAHLAHQPEPSGNAQVPRWVVYLMIVAVVAVVGFVWRGEVTKLLMPIMESPFMPEVSVEGVPNNSGSGIQQPEGGAMQQALPLPSLPESRGTAAAPAPESAAPAPDTTQAPPPPQPDLPQAHLSLKAEKPSWVEIKDGTGKRLFYDLMVPGDERTLEGVPPFEVLLGYAPGVIVEYNGKRVDHSSYTRQDMARFRVGDKGTSRN